MLFGSSFFLRILLLTACKRIEDGIEPGIENENPLNLEDDISEDEESIYQFDLHNTLKNIYDTDRPPPSKMSPRAPWEKQSERKKRRERRIKLVFENQEDEIAFRNCKKSSNSEMSGYSSEYIISESEPFEQDSSDVLVASESS